MLVPLRVRDVMSDTVETVSPEATVAAAAERLRATGIGSLLVTDGDGRPGGIVTAGDLVATMAEGRDAAATRVREAMTPSPVTVDLDTSVRGAARILREHGFEHLPVTEDGAVVGVLSTTDLAYAIERMATGDRDRYALPGSDEMAYEAPGWEFTHENGEGEGVSVGDAVRFTKELSDADVRAFAEASGDTNRLHLDESFAGRTRFGRRIVHGTLVGGVVSAALARIPGLTIYLSQEVEFHAPVDVGDTVTAVCEVVEDLGRDRFRVVTAVYDGEGERVVDGEAIVLIDDLPVPESEKLEPVGERR